MRTRWFRCPARKLPALPKRERGRDLPAWARVLTPAFPTPTRASRPVGAGPGVAGGRGPLATGVLTATAHVGRRPTWDCGRCGEPWPCPAFRAIRVESGVLLPVMSSLLRTAIPDLRGRPEGPEPPEIVRRFLWFLPLTGEEARAVARRLR